MALLGVIIGKCEMPSTNISQENDHAIIITYLLRPRETVCFVDPRPSMFPEAKPRETSTVEGPQNTLFPSVSVNKCFIIYQ